MTGCEQASGSRSPRLCGVVEGSVGENGGEELASQWAF